MSDDVEALTARDREQLSRISSGSVMRWTPPGDAADVPPWSWLVGWVDEQVTP